jgi:hypothetical protein
MGCRTSGKDQEERFMLKIGRKAGMRLILGDAGWPAEADYSTLIVECRGVNRT